MNIRVTKSGRMQDVEMGSLSSMIDIVFQLIIFFVVTASLDSAQLDREVALPQLPDHTAIRSLPPNRLVLNVRQDGEVRVGFVAIQADEIPAQLPHLLRELADPAEVQIILHADARTRHRHIEKVMQVAAARGYHNIEINAEVGNAETEQ